MKRRISFDQGRQGQRHELDEDHDRRDVHEEDRERSAKAPAGQPADGDVEQVDEQQADDERPHAVAGHPEEEADDDRGAEQDA